MTTERTLQRVDPQRSEVEVVSPAAVVALATERANVLMDIIKKRKLSISIKGNDYPLFEAWQIIGAFDSAAPSTESVEPLRDQETGEIIGYKAKVNIMKHGEVISSAISMCGMDEHVTQGQAGSAKHNAAMSMAQTRAASKAYRAAYSFIMELAGLKATPAEEMPRDDPEATRASSTAKPRPQQTGNGEIFPPQPVAGKCPIHDAPWFQSRDKKDWLHPNGTDETGKKLWCIKSQVDAEEVLEGEVVEAR